MKIHKLTGYKCYIFDFDGTLIDSRNNISNSLNTALAAHGLSTIDTKAIIPFIGKRNIEQTLFYFYPDIGKNRKESIIELFRSTQKLNAHKELKLFPHVKSALKELLHQEKKLVIVSTKNINQLIYILKLFDIHDLFHLILGEDESTPSSFRKPESGRFKEVQKEFSFLKSEYLMVGDTVIDCKFAINCGIDMCGVSFGIDSPRVLKASGAKIIIHSFQELV